jgi:MATE family multidrug resistance protein
MTTRAPLYPRTADLVRLAIPVMLAGMSTPLMGMVDTAMLGRLGDPALIAAAGIGGTIFTVLYWCFAFLRLSTTGLVAQAAGRNDSGEVALQGLRPLLAALGGGLLLWALQWPLVELAMALIAPPPGVAEPARQYFEVRIWSAPFTLANYALMAWLMGLRRSRTVMLLQLFMNGLNALLCAVLVLVLGYGIAGAALATVLAEAITAALTVAVILRRLPLPAWRLQFPRVFEAAAWRRLLAANADIVIRTLLLTLGLALFTERGVQFGTLTLAANQILLQAFLLMANLLDGFAIAAEVYGGRAVGAGDRAALTHVVKRCALLSLAWGALLAAGLAVSAPLYLPLMTVEPALIAEALRYWPWLAVSPLLCIWAFLWDGVFFGATRTRVLRNTMIIALFIYLGAVQIFIAAWGNHGLWAALLTLMLARSVGLSLAWPALRRSVAVAG